MISVLFGKWNKLYICFVLLYLISSLFCFCDEILMRNGRRMQVDIISDEEDSVSVIEEKSGILLKIPRNQISDVIYEEDKIRIEKERPLAPPKETEGEESPAVIITPLEEKAEEITPETTAEESKPSEEEPSTKTYFEPEPPEARMLANLKKIKAAILEYTYDTGFFPEDSENWFMTLMVNPQLEGWKGPYITDDSIFIDTWRSRIYYAVNRSPFSDAQYAVLVVIGPNRKYDGGYVDDLKEVITVTKPIVEQITPTPTPEATAPPPQPESPAVPTTPMVEAPAPTPTVSPEVPTPPAPTPAVTPAPVTEPEVAPTPTPTPAPTPPPAAKNVLGIE